ncbi:MAG: hypothetical protein ACHQ9S_27120 [Candidatus Binatia bacterium]
MSKKRKARASGPPTAMHQRQPRAMTPYVQHLLETGHLRMQRWDTHNWQLALEMGEDPNDPRSILHGGTPSDAASYAPAPAPKTASITAEPRVSNAAVLRLMAAAERLRKVVLSRYPAEPRPISFMRDPATGAGIVERR